MTWLVRPPTLKDSVSPKPPTGWRDVEATLGHFAIVTYAVPPERVRPHVDERFELDVFVNNQGEQRVWVSAVPFEDQDFHFVGMPWPTFRFGQTNYRTYVIDRVSRRRAVWFFGTSLDSWSVAIPRYLWRLPWHRGRIRFDCQYDTSAARYTRYHMRTESDWAAVELELTDSGEAVNSLNVMDDFEGSMLILTHPLIGVFRRRETSQLGTYSIWHDRLNCTAAEVKTARFALFERLGLVTYDEQTRPHSALIQPRCKFTIYLPPKALSHAGMP